MRKGSSADIGESNCCAPFYKSRWERYLLINSRRAGFGWCFANGDTGVYSDHFGEDVEDRLGDVRIWLIRRV